ncbi:MAG: NlpC/P60 family protein [Pseudomonadota bacterium]
MSDENTRNQALGEARRWIGTPYRHQASKLGVGCDCLGLVRGIWRELYGADPAEGLAYSKDWSLTQGKENLLVNARVQCIEITIEDAMPGDLLIFRWTANAVCRHLAIKATETTIIHAFERHAVMENSLVPSWRRRIAAAFKFPPQ